MKPIFPHPQEKKKINCIQIFEIRCAYAIAAEQKARATYDNILRLVDDPDVRDPIKFLRQREINHFQRFGEAIPTISNKTPLNLPYIEKHPYKTGAF